VPSWPHFSEDELRCHHCGMQGMDPEFMDLLERIRVVYGKPMRLSSAYRCPDYNEQVSTTGRDGPHTTGKAVDVLVAGADARELVAVALQMGIQGLGVKQKGLWAARFLHLDTLAPRVWSY